MIKTLEIHVSNKETNTFLKMSGYEERNALELINFLQELGAIDKKEIAENIKIEPKIQEVTIDDGKNQVADKKYKLNHFSCCGHEVFTTKEEPICRNCGKKQDYSEGIILDIKCPNCGGNVRAQTNNKNFKLYKCGRCESPVDLTYNKKNNKVISL